MFILIGYILVFLSLSAALAVCVFLLFGLWTSIKGAPYVPTSRRLIKEILIKAKLKKGGWFIELGSGDGRVTRMAVGVFGMKGLGVELNPMLVLYSKVLTYLQGMRDAKFMLADCFGIDLAKADCLFLFLLPKALERLKVKIEKECRKGTIIISHGFRIKGWERKQAYILAGKVFPTYYYKL